MWNAMKRLTLKQSTFLLIGIISILMLGIVVGVVIPSIQKIKALKKEINQTQMDIENQYEQTKRLKRSLRELSTAKIETDKYKSAKIKRGEELYTITKLEALATAHHIEQTLHITEIDAGFVFSFLNHGEFMDQINYLKALEGLPFYLLIERMQWEKNSAATITVRFDAKIYVE